MTVRQSDARMISELRALGWAGYLPGFGLGGFFHGILLHQILQWHHLLSLVTRPPFQDLRIQILADGLFHPLMYVIAFAGLWRLWKSFGGRGGAAALVLAVLVGGPVAALPPGVDTVMVFYQAGTKPAAVFAGIEAVDGRILWSSSPAGDVWALDVKDRSRTALPCRHGARMVSNSALAIGCLAWTSARG